MPRTFSFLLLIAGCLTACSAPSISGTTMMAGPNSSSISSDEVINPLDLSDYLRRITGVQVSGSGAGAVISIRGPITLNAGQGPLYVLNGAIFGHDYAELYSTINMQEISQVRVLKNAEEVGFYGTRGAAGVIEIDTKSAVD